MKKRILAISVAAVTTAGAAAAADLPRGPVQYYPPPASVYNWNGFYAGLNIGYEWGKVTNSGFNPGGVAGGGQLGYNWQIGQFVLGGETDIQASAATILSRRTSSPIPGSELFAAAQASQSTTYCSSQRLVSPTATSKQS